MPTLGNANEPVQFWHGYGGSSQVNQEAERLTAPSRIRLLTLGQWVGGWSDAPRVRLCVWDLAGALLGQSAQITVSNEGAGGNGQVAHYTEDLETPVELEAGDVFHVGFNRHPDDAHQVMSGAAATGPHYEGRSGATWPNALGNVSGPFTVNRRIGAYVADYELIAGAYVMRGGVWSRAEAVSVMRSGAWVEADTVAVSRAGVWEDAQ